MAKVKGPFFSIRASGTVGKLMTARRLHGAPVISAVPIPTDHKSTNQVVNRGYFSEACEHWKTNNWVDLDLSGFKLRTSLEYPKINAWNYFLKEYISGKAQGLITDSIFKVNWAPAFGTQFHLKASILTSMNLIIKYGFSSDNLENTLNVVEHPWPSYNEAFIAKTASGVPFYFRYEALDSGFKAVSGIYEIFGY